jgi:hypothetical protein
MVTENDVTPEPVEETDDQAPVETPHEDPSEPSVFVVPDAEPDTGFTTGH